MRRIRVAVALGAILLVSGCGAAPKPVALPKLSQPLRNFIHSWMARLSDGGVDQLDVYGPGTRAALVKASMGRLTDDKSKGSYLVVLHDKYVCSGCTGPALTRVDIAVWSQAKGPTDWAIMKRLLPTVKKLHRVAKVSVGR